MTRSLNGWSAIFSGSDTRLAYGTVPGCRKGVLLNRIVLPVFLAALSEVNKNVISVDGGYGPDGWAYREARSGDGLSNHASGTAVDFRYDVFKADNRRHCTDAQIHAMHAILDLFTTTEGKRIFGWGGDWKAVDEMHLEIGQAWQPGVGSPVTSHDIADVIGKLHIQPDGTRLNTEDDVPLTAEEIEKIAQRTAQLVWDRQWREYTDKGDGVLNVRKASDFLVATDANAWKAAQK